jgi:tight adherence protein C
MDDRQLFMICIAGAVGLIVFWAWRTFQGNGDTKLRKRLRDQVDPVAERKSSEGITDVLRSIGEAAAKPFEPTTVERQSDLRRKLARAGIYSPSARRLMSGGKTLFLIAGLVGGYLLGAMLSNILLGVSIGGLAGYMIPSLWLRTMISRQQVALDRGLADAIDLLVVCVEAGLTIDGAMQRVGEEISIAHPSLAREFEIAHMETRVGISRMDALKNLGIRTGNGGLQSLGAMLVQAERFGTSIASALRIQAESLRSARQHQAEEIAAKTTVKLSFPVVLFIFPAVLIVLAGPAVLGLFKSSLFDN